ncbi:hypothetical protein TNCV_789001 [Trichonephila clavipes]|nr:hypothetical protein TNCV_789001 [Trichonephila clavipes]
MKKRMDSVSHPPNRCHVEEIVRRGKKGSGIARDLRHIPEKLEDYPPLQLVDMLPSDREPFSSGGWPPFSCGVPNQSTNVIERTTQWDMFETFRFATLYEE